MVRAAHGTDLCRRRLSNQRTGGATSTMTTKGAVFFITGASRGLGLAFAQEAVKRGAAKVYAGVRTPSEPNMPGIEQIKMDVTDPVSVASAADRCSDVTILINNAGIGRVHSGALDPVMIDAARE